MRKTIKLPFAAATVAILAMIVVSQFTIYAQPTPSLQPGFNQAIDAIDKAEAAGATQSEIRPLVSLLNDALDLNLEAQEAPNGSAARTQRLMKVDQLLITVEIQAGELTIVASHRAFLNEVLAYIGGIVAAIVATVAYISMVELNERRFVNRTFRMRVRPK